MKIVVIGCTHAGTAAILNARKRYPQADISVYERNDNISFLSCGIALYVGGVIKNPEGLFYCSVDELKAKSVKTYMKYDVTEVDIRAKKLKAKSLDSGEVVEDTFDKLIITTGSWPIIPPIPGIEYDNILLSKNFNHSNEIIERGKNAKKVVVVGAGYIGVELVEAFQENGKEVVLIDAEERILSKYLDKEFTDIATKTFEREGIKVATGEKVTKFEDKDGKVSAIVTDKGNKYQADMVIMCVGFHPNTKIFEGQIDMLGNGAIVVDAYMQTSAKDVMAAGDCCAIYYNPTKSYQYIPLATNAVRMGTLAAINLKGPRVEHPGTQGTSAIKIYENCMASTGLTEENAKTKGFTVDSVTVTDNYRPEFMPSNDQVTLKVVFEADTRRILGAQLTSHHDLTQSMNTLSICVQKEMTIDELALVDFFFQPHFNKPWNFLNLAGVEAAGKGDRI